MADELTLSLKPKKWQCSNGHEWEDAPGSSSIGAGQEICFSDPRKDEPGQMSLKLGPYCNICMYDKLKAVLETVGIVSERE